MYIDPFVAGIVVTLLFEIGIIIVAAIINTIRKEK